MTEPLDRIDREICAALLRNGRASWRQIAQATALQERTVARRGARLLEQGLVRVNAFLQHSRMGRGDAYIARLSCAPQRLRETANWLAHRSETLWVTTLTSESAVVAECFLKPDLLAPFVEEELGAQAVEGFSFAPINRYFRTVRGWQPNVLKTEQLDQLGEDESFALLASERPSPEFDQTDFDIASLLSRDGRMSIDAISSTLGIAKPTASKRIQRLQQSDALSIRAVIDPALFGLPFEAMVTACAPLAQLETIGSALAANWSTRWVAETASESAVRALVALPDRQHLALLLHDLETGIGPETVRPRAEQLLTMYKRSDILTSAAG
ncbi:MAG: Lrp/AsnC family transcriptional regulator [Leucobacter sp.]